MPVPGLLTGRSPAPDPATECDPPAAEAVAAAPGVAEPETKGEVAALPRPRKSDATPAAKAGWGNAAARGGGMRRCASQVQQLGQNARSQGWLIVIYILAVTTMRNSHHPTHAQSTTALKTLGPPAGDVLLFMPLPASPSSTDGSEP